MSFKSFLALMIIAIASTGCTTVKLSSYVPEETGQVVRFENGVGTITAENDDVRLLLYPTFKLQQPEEIPTFTLSITNKSDHDVDFNPQNIAASLDSKPVGVYTLEQRVGEIRSNKIRTQVALAILGGVTAAVAANAASHSSATYTSYGHVGRTRFAEVARVDTVDPLAGLVVGGAVVAGTAVAIHQVDNAAGNEEAAAEGILQRSTLRPGDLLTGQVMVRRPKNPPRNRVQRVELVVTIDNKPNAFLFRKVTSSY